MLPNLGFFARILIKKVFMVLLSFIGLSISLMCIFLPGLAYSALLIWLAYVEFGKGVKRHMLDSNPLQDQRLDP